MKEDQFDKDIMDYIDGVKIEVTNEDAYDASETSQKDGFRSQRNTSSECKSGSR